ncbi:serine carboxypeptidase [Dacryopinax primogenitus]|uniref:Carboxypeptidase n=1 Tax=Dacryopinax primogenitus (strain DJM 731) TaxID=1858805 RepID=M5G775_DACPD|nr:serine carboxypeptidase [Dacryopinax primogenitus]EJU04579.1 serine carboxypeptidase [Dacryopinax primogenitus]
MRLLALLLPALTSALQLPLRFPQSYGSHPTAPVSPLQDFPAPEQSLSALSSEEYTTLTHTQFPGYAVRIRQTTGWCDPNVRSWSGYLDVGGGAKHLFFYFFESRRSPSTDPLLMWINGGPGCSSSLGLFMELGPCRLSPSGNETVPHPYAWNEQANVFFLDQPVGVGFSYADYEGVDNTEDAAKDVAAFVSIFVETFVQFNGREFHMAGESYAGRYLPVFASEIVDRNKRAPALGLQEINLKSVLIGNGITDFMTMIPAYYEMACTGASVPPILDISQCVRMKRALPRCQQMAQSSCVDIFDNLACTAAELFCSSELEDPFFASGMNPYDISQECDGPIEETLCYPIVRVIERYLNLNSTRKTLGVDDKVRRFAGCSAEVGTAFSQKMDMVAPGPIYITALLERGINVLIYVGTLDWICNWVGNLAWVEALQWGGAQGFEAVPMGEWQVSGGRAGITKGWKGLTYATVEGAGHMVPLDKPVEALEMVNRWLDKMAL